MIDDLIIKIDPKFNKMYLIFQVFKKNILKDKTKPLIKIL